MCDTRHFDSFRFFRDIFRVMCELSKLTNQKVYRELVYRHEVFKKMITGSSSFPLFLCPIPPLVFVPSHFPFAPLSRSLEQASGSVKPYIGFLVVGDCLSPETVVCVHELVYDRAAASAVAVQPNPGKTNFCSYSVYIVDV